MLKTFLVPAAILVLPFAPTFSAEGTARYELHVDGLACPFCVRGLEKKLQALPGAFKLQVDLATGVARLESKAALLPESLDKAVRDAGFSPRAIRMTVSGVLQISGEQPVLQIAEGKALALAGGPSSQRLSALIASGKRDVVVSGEASRVGGRWVLSVAEVEVIR